MQRRSFDFSPARRTMVVKYLHALSWPRSKNTSFKVCVCFPSKDVSLSHPIELERWQIKSTSCLRRYSLPPVSLFCDTRSERKQKHVRPQLAAHPDARGDLEVFVNEALRRTGQKISMGTIIKPRQIRGSKKMGPLKTRLSLKESINLMLHSGREDDGKAERHTHGNLTHKRKPQKAGNDIKYLLVE